MQITQVYNIISIVAFSLAGVAFVFSIFCWVKLEIWDIIGDLSGRTAKKSIAQMRAENERSGAKMHAPTPGAKKRGTVTELIQIKNVVEEQIEGFELIQNILLVHTEENI